MSNYVFTSESVSEGHPDKVCDYISDSILDTHLAQDPHARVACETLAKGNTVVLAGEITSTATVDHVAVVRRAVEEIGYTDAREPFCASTLHVFQMLSQQAAEIGNAVGNLTGAARDAAALGVRADAAAEQGAGDQGIMFGYATDETPELMPLPILFAHRLAAALARHRKAGVAWLLPDAKTQVSVRYENDRPAAVTAVLVSTQHRASVESGGRAIPVTQDEIRHFVATTLLPEVLGEWNDSGPELIVNPSGSFTQGGPSADSGLTGRKIIVDTYGGFARHGGGAFSGKDPSKVDRSAAYFCRWVARRIVREGIARRAELQVAYAIGRAKPVSIKVDTFGTGDSSRAERFVGDFDFRPGAMIERLDLLRPIYRSTTNYGHFGKTGLPWEE
jgi:S-adenosylmethionine synthetase